MARRVRRDRETQIDYWPSFTDAILSVVLILVFLVMIFVLSQTGLFQALESKEEALVDLNTQLNRLEQDLRLSEERSQKLESEVDQALDQLRKTRVTFAVTSEDLARTRQALTDAQSRLDNTQSNLTSTTVELTEAMTRMQAVEQSREQTEEQLAENRRLLQELSNRVASYVEQLTILNEQLSSARQEAAEKDASLTSLNAAVDNLNQRISELSSSLEESRGRVQEQKLELTRLLDQIEERDEEIERLKRFEKYRSEFLAQLADVFEGENDIRVIGDRFAFQGEVLFDSGKAELRPDGKQLLDRFAAIYARLADRIPPESGLNIQVQGHTDTDPISTSQFPSNWHLSNARALAVVEYLISKGVPPSRLSAAGYSEHYPAVAASTEEAKRQNRRIEIFFTQRR